VGLPHTRRNNSMPLLEAAVEAVELDAFAKRSQISFFMAPQATACSRLKQQMFPCRTSLTLAAPCEHRSVCRSACRLARQFRRERQRRFHGSRYGLAVASFALAPCTCSTSAKFVACSGFHGLQAEGSVRRSVQNFSGCCQITQRHLTKSVKTSIIETIPRKDRMSYQTKLAYLAGFFDGEGSFSICRTRFHPQNHG